MHTSFECRICGVKTAPVLTHVRQSGQKISFVNGPSFVSSNYFIKVCLHGAVLDLDVRVYSLHFRDDRIHRLVRYFGPWMRKVVPKHQYDVSCPIDASCFDCVIVGNLDKLFYMISDVILQHRHPVPSIKKVKFSWR